MTATPEKFTTKPRTVEAMQFDGTVGSREEIERWVLSQGGQVDLALGISDGNPWVNVAGRFERVTPTDWVVRDVEDEDFAVVPPIMFTELFDRVVGENDYARIYTDQSGQWRYQVFAGNHRQIGASEDGRSDRSGALRELKREWPHIANISEQRNG